MCCVVQCLASVNIIISIESDYMGILMIFVSTYYQRNGSLAMDRHASQILSPKRRESRCLFTGLIDKHVQHQEAHLTGAELIFAVEKL